MMRTNDMRPTIFFCQLGMNNPSNTLCLNAKGRTWTYSDSGSGLTLLGMEIDKGTEVGVQVFGKKCHELLDQILRFSQNKFGVTC